MTKINIKRQMEFDYIKTLALFFMVIIHVLEEISAYGAYEKMPAGLWENLIEFGAGPLAAPAFMCAMGVGIIYSHSNEPSDLFRRGVRILILAIGLNLVRGVIPTFTVSVFRGNIDPDRIFYLMFNVDILHLAGLSFMLTALLKKLHVPPLATVPIAIVMQMIGNWLPPLTEDCPVVFYILGSFFHTSPLSAFPLLICYIHVAVGIALGDILIRQKNLDKFYRVVFWESISLLAGLLFTLVSLGYDLKNLYVLYDELYYEQTFLHFTFNTLVLMLELSLFHFMLNRFRPAEGFVRFCGKNLNSIYLVQWVIIGVWVGFELWHLHGLPPVPVLNTMGLFSRIRAGYDISDASSLEQIKKATVPILFIHGSKDNFVATDMVYQLYDACPTQKELYIVENAGHAESFYLNPEAYFEKVFAFLDDTVVSK